MLQSVGRRLRTGPHYRHVSAARESRAQRALKFQSFTKSSTPAQATMSEDPRVAEVRARWDEFAERFTETANKRTTHQCARELHANLQLETAQVVLEVAAGGGIGSLDVIERLAKNPSVGPKKFIVTDLAPTMVRLARENLKDVNVPGVEIDIREANGQDLQEIPDASVDRYVSNLCLQLTPDPDAMLREAKRVLKPDGIVGFTIWAEEAHSGAFVIDSAVLKKLGLGDGSSHGNFAMGRDLKLVRSRFERAGFSQVQIWPYLTVAELWSGDEFAHFYEKHYPSSDEEMRQRKFEIAKRLADEWLAKGYPIGLETYIILARPYM